MIATPAATLPGTHAPDLTLSERLITGVHDLWRHLLGLSPQAVALNIGITAAIAIVCWLAIWALNASLCYAVGHIPGHDGAAGRKAIQKALRITRAAIALIFVLVGIVMIGSIWGVDIFAWMSAGFASKLSHTLLTLFIVLVVTAVAFEASGLFIGYSLGRLKAQKGLDLRRGAQIDTLGPIIRRTLQAAILVVGAMTVLSQLGVQIAPLLAGAGVVGIAVGFGAQTLMKDFFTGFFLLIEDVVAVGDIVTIGNSTGEVEEMTLRYISLRDFDGTLHVFPYGEAQIIHNLTKSFSRYVFDLPVTLASDIDAAIRLIRETGETLQAEPEWKPLIIEPIEVMGVDMLADFGALIKARITTTPHERWRVGREFHRRIKLAFDGAGIAIGHKGAYVAS
jgi:small conductance mechanosensitive channel